MPSSYTSLSYHIVYGTKYRRQSIAAEFQAELYKYIAGTIANKDGQVIEIGGIEDHVHILTSCHPRMALADFIRDIKANSSKWIHEQGWVPDFAWQVGYAAFTVSHSQEDVVRAYIRNQAEHHSVRTFEDELRALLQRHGIAYDERYLFETEHYG